MSQESIGEKIREKFPHFVMSAMAALIFWFVGSVSSSLIGDIIIPGINVNAGFLVWVSTILIAMIFMVRALSDALTLVDIATEVIVKSLGVKEKRPLKRAARDLIYIILAILLSGAALPILGSVPNVGHLLSATVSLMALVIFLVLVYDIGKILYRIVENKAEIFADRLAEHVERDKE